MGSNPATPTNVPGFRSGHDAAVADSTPCLTRGDVVDLMKGVACRRGEDPWGPPDNYVGVSTAG